MSEEKQNREESHAMPQVWQEIEKEAKQVSDESTRQRELLCQIRDAIGEVAKVAGIFYTNNEWWKYEDASDYGDITNRLVIRKYTNWEIRIEKTEAQERYWDGSNWVGHENPFGIDERSEMVYSRAVEEMTRKDMQNFVDELPAFLIAYAGELKERHLQYAETRKKVEKIAEVLGA